MEPNYRFTAKAQQIISRAAQHEAQRLGSDFIEPEHVFLSLMKDESAIPFKILVEMEVDIEQICFNITDSLKTGNITLKKEVIPHSERIETILNYSYEESRSIQHKYVGIEHLLLGLYKEEGSMTRIQLQEFGITSNDLKQIIIRIVDNGFLKESYANNRKDANSRSVEGFEKTTKHSEKKNNSTSTLDNYSIDFTKLAKEKKLDPVIGREKEIDRMVQILSRRNKNNPILIGEPGVGKSAIVEGLANKIIQREIPDLLLDKRVICLDLAACISGTKYRGEFEDRLKNIMVEIKKAGNIILFIDEIHTIIGSGGAEGSLDTANILKPNLSRGDFQCIGATTLSEFKKYVEKDRALERRFQKININEPSVPDTIKILKGLKHRYEEFHNVEYSQEVIEQSVRYAKRYFSHRFLPDSAIDLIDEAGSKLRLLNTNRPLVINKIEEKLNQLAWKKDQMVKNQKFEKAAVCRDQIKQRTVELEKAIEEWKNKKKSNPVKITVEEIAKVVKNMTNIPVTELEQKESKRLKNMDQLLNSKIIGQKFAVESLVRSYKRSRAGINSGNRPAGSFIFLGPTGVGKSELAKRLAEFVFGTKDALVKIDMSEFMEKHNVSRLVGAPPGYVGYQEGGQLTDLVRQKPYSIILFDEIEKAHPDFFNILLQVLEDGVLTDQLGNKVDFRNTIIIMTSNLGSKDMVDASQLGFRVAKKQESYEELKSIGTERAKKHFSPEFINRLNDILVFQPLEKKGLIKIVDLFLNDLQDNLKSKNIVIHVTNNAKKHLIEKGYDVKYGARPLRRVIENEITDLIAESIIEQKIIEGDAVEVDEKDGKLFYKKKTDA